jgi:hypothetical protein
MKSKQNHRLNETGGFALLRVQFYRELPSPLHIRHLLTVYLFSRLQDFFSIQQDRGFFQTPRLPESARRSSPLLPPFAAVTVCIRYPF